MKPEFPQDGSERGSITCLASTLMTRNQSLGGSPPGPGWENRSAPRQSVLPHSVIHARPMGCLIQMDLGKFAGPAKSINLFIVHEVLTRSSWIRLGKPGGSRRSEDLQQQPGGLRGPPGEILLRSVKKTTHRTGSRTRESLALTTSSRSLKQWHEQPAEGSTGTGKGPAAGSLPSQIRNALNSFDVWTTILTLALTYNTLIYQHV